MAPRRVLAASRASKASKAAAKVPKIPALSKVGLLVHPILADGNCLFRAFADQLGVDVEKHHEFRTKVVTWMREHPEDFKYYLAVGPAKRNASRAASRRAAAARPVDHHETEEAQLNKTWEQYLVKMATLGEWGDELAIRAFTQAYNVDVTVWYENEVQPRVNTAVDGVYAQIQIHLVFDTSADHYSSVRNINGPFSGPPALTYVEKKRRSKSKVEDTASVSKAAEEVVGGSGRSPTPGSDTSATLCNASDDESAPLPVAASVSKVVENAVGSAGGIKRRRESVDNTDEHMRPSKTVILPSNSDE